MITDIIKIKGDGKGSDEALTATEKAAKYNDLTGKEAIRLRLLTEELIGMFHGIAGGNGDADFWIEENNKEYKIHMKAEVEMNQEVRKEFLSLSRTGENAAAKGFMGKLRDRISIALMPDPEADMIQRSIPIGYMAMGCPESYEHTAAFLWTLQDYKNSLDNADKEDNEEAWDELEKSIVANIADDVQVSVKGSVVDVAIIKKF